MGGLLFMVAELQFGNEESGGEILQMGGGKVCNVTYSINVLNVPEPHT